MSTEKLQNIILIFHKHYILQLIAITISLLLIVFSMLASSGSDISFIYSNF